MPKAEVIYLSPCECHPEDGKWSPFFPPSTSSARTFQYSPCGLNSELDPVNQSSVFSSISAVRWSCTQPGDFAASRVPRPVLSSRKVPLPDPTRADPSQPSSPTATTTANHDCHHYHYHHHNTDCSHCRGRLQWRKGNTLRPDIILMDRQYLFCARNWFQSNWLSNPLHEFTIKSVAENNKNRSVWRIS